MDTNFFKVPKNILKSLPELIDAGVLSENTATDIRKYYHQKSSKSGNSLFIVFGVLGAILVGLGIILIIAHNWDDLSRTIKTNLAFLPLVVGQIICGYVILKRLTSVAWRESAAAFLFFTVGASISLISQIYNIPGNLGSFLLTWMVLCLPLVYLMRSSITSLLVLVGITFYACETSYWSFPNVQSYGYWLVLALLIPHYLYLTRKKADSNFLIFHHWFFPLSVIICLGTLAGQSEELMFISYMSLFGLLYLLGNSKEFKSQLLRNSAYKVIGSLGTISLLLSMSFDWLWNELGKLDVDILNSPEIYVLTLITILAISLLIKQKVAHSWSSIHLMEITFILFIIIFVLGFSSPLFSVIAINVLVFALGIVTIRKGVIENHLGILNYGLFIITALVICRFFDTDISFIIRGILFIIVGIGFFTTNYLMLKRRRVLGTGNS